MSNIKSFILCGVSLAVLGCTPSTEPVSKSSESTDAASTTAELNRVDSLLAPPSWSLGFGYVFLDGNAIVGGRFAFNLQSSGDDDESAGETVSARSTGVSGELVPYFRYLFMPGKRVRPFLEGRFGFGGSASSRRVDSDPELRSSASEIHPLVGIGGGAHVFLLDAFSIDLALTFDYAAPHTKSRTEAGDISMEEDYSKAGDFINLAAQAGFSVWF